ncbi:RHS repeat domain-containing protein [Rhodoligotrophos defluvii]|uniref:RHS repeat domain-containing protein n=1 Tax=Rhodoligotrophos defluvii TaxID=2561934 RepID=UPI0010C974F2|nr:RHS repeat-associated core domain-containing protein [Rhodoligotrophos defluvii]
MNAWGKRREVTWQAMADATAYVPLVTTRGFTGHEQLDPVGLVHMNGRVYDPELGRFLSADPFLQDVSNLQAWNRYSYVLNNPLSMTDPTGFFFGKVFKAIGNFLKGVFKAISSIVKAVIKAIGNTPLLRAAIQAVACANPAAVFTCVPVAGALTLAAGGSITDALQAMAFSIASMGGAGLAQGLAGACRRCAGPDRDGQCAVAERRQRRGERRAVGGARRLVPQRLCRGQHRHLQQSRWGRPDREQRVHEQCDLGCRRGHCRGGHRRQVR